MIVLFWNSELERVPNAAGSHPLSTETAQKQNKKRGFQTILVAESDNQGTFDKERHLLTIFEKYNCSFYCNTL